MPIALYRIDDRLIHGQVVVGWGQPLGVGFIILMDDDVAACDWEQDLYRMGVPPDVDVSFMSVDQAIGAHARYAADPRVGILLAGNAASMLRFVRAVPAVRSVNVGGMHHRPGRTHKLRYVFLTTQEEQALRDIAAQGHSTGAA
jgi:mannose/fructose/N-acetylgalactosamine-specific phosphotransferase system component IIB